MFNRILLPLDRSALAECVVPHAVAIARAFSSQVALLHVLETFREARGRRAMDPLHWEIRKAEARAYLQGLERRLQAEGVPSEAHILEGSAAQQVIGFSDATAAQLIILSSHGQSGLSDWGVSGVVRKITLRAQTSVMIVRAAKIAEPNPAGLRYRRILVPMDGTQRAESILPAAAALAGAHSAQIVLAHIVRKPDVPRRTLPSREDAGLADRLAEHNQADAVQYLDQLRSRLAGSVEARVLVSDHPAAALQELVEKESADLVLLSAHGGSSRGRRLDGDMVSHLMAYGTTPLVILQELDAPASAPLPASGGETGRP
jgi:nucleotide-binding universal stress UspA family protein